MLLLDNPIQAYPWGCRDGLAATVGTLPTGGPEAELWVGAHRRAPSVVAAGPDVGRTLAAVLADDGVELPFLLKVLCIAEPLSLQAHPSAAMAAAGFAREEAAGVPLDAEHRTYRDANPKPEALVALVDTWALCGFRPAAHAAALIGEVGASLAELVDHLRGVDEREALREGLSWLLHLRPDQRSAVAADLAAAVAAHPTDDPDSPWYWTAELVERYPADPSALAPLLLEVVHLRPGDAVHLVAGNLHAYLRGAGIEVMASSDNVLRGGLTPKHIDVDELLAVLRFEPGVPPAPTTRRVGAITCYDAGEDAFALARLAPGGGAVDLDVVAPSLLLPVGGEVTVRTTRGPATDAPVRVGHGRAVYLAADTAVEVRGDAEVWWATTGDGLPTS